MHTLTRIFPLALILSACSGAPSALLPPATPLAAAVTAVQPTASPPLVIAALGDSIAAGAGSTQVNGVSQSFAQLAAASLNAASFTNLAVPSTTCAYATAMEVPQIPPATNLVIIDCGTNDVDQQVANATDFPALIAAVKARVPASKIVIVNIYQVANPNSTVAAVSAWNAMEKASAAGATVVDIQNNTAVTSQLADGVHPLFAACEIIAGLIVTAIR